MFMIEQMVSGETSDEVKIEAKICQPKVPMDCSTITLKDDGLTG